MANRKHLKILKKGTDIWNQWRNINFDIKPDLKNANLRNVNFTGANLNNADLSEADLTRANLTRVNLCEANLRGVSLSGADLSGAVLYGLELRGLDLNETALFGVDLRQADLRGTNLSGADLSEANLTMADVSEADLKRAKLRKANLKRANLFRTDLSCSDLRGAYFYGAFIHETRFLDVDLCKTKGLDKVIHLAPSSIDIATIYKSKGQIPEVFLRGCGLPENFIQYIKSLRLSSIKYFSCFISYSQEDNSFARRLHNQMQTLGIRCWLDEKQLLPKEDIHEQVDRDIGMWNKVLLCCSKNSLTSWWVDNEVAAVFRKEQQLMKEQGNRVLSLIPINLDGYLFSDECTSGKSQQIKERLAADFTGWKADDAKFKEQFERLVQALQVDFVDFKQILTSLNDEDESVKTYVKKVPIRDKFTPIQPRVHIDYDIAAPSEKTEEAPSEQADECTSEQAKEAPFQEDKEVPFEETTVIQTPEPSSKQVGTSDPSRRPSEPNNLMQTIKNELDSYPLGQILFNPPKTMRVGTSERIEVRITQNLKIDLTKNLKGKGIPEMVTKKVAPFMKVKLSGTDFEINALNEESQIVSADDFTEWAWNVLPVKSGKKKLHLLISIRVKLSFGEEKKDFPIIDKDIEVRVNRIHSTKLFVVKHWKWIVTAIVSPILAWIVKTWLTKP